MDQIDSVRREFASEGQMLRPQRGRGCGRLPAGRIGCFRVAGNNERFRWERVDPVRASNIKVVTFMHDFRRFDWMDGEE